MVRQQDACAPEPVEPTWRYDFIATTPDISLFPRVPWRRALEAALRDAPDLALDYGDHRGRIELRETLASYLGRVRGVRVEPGRMVITQGFSQALDLLCRTLAARGARTIAMENPSLANLWLTVRSWGLRSRRRADGRRRAPARRPGPPATRRVRRLPRPSVPDRPGDGPRATRGAGRLGVHARPADHRGRLRRGEPV